MKKDKIEEVEAEVPEKKIGRFLVRNTKRAAVVIGSLIVGFALANVRRKDSV